MMKAEKTFSAIDKTIKNFNAELKKKEISVIRSMSAGTAVVDGLSGAQMSELLEFKNNIFGMVQTLDGNNIGVVFLNNPESLTAGDSVSRTGRVLDVPVGKNLLGRVINPLGEPLDNKGQISCSERRPIETDAHQIMDRSAVNTPLQTGIKAVDAFTPIGRGQRELILGDRQTGKTAIAVDTIINQKNTGVICIYCAIGQRRSAVASVVSELQNRGVMPNTIVVSSAADDQAGMQYIAPYSATAIGEYFMEHGKDVLIVYDDLTNHARAYREMSLLLRCPPGREAFPGDIFYIHSRLLERSTKLSPELGGGSLTSLPIVSTEAGNISAYIPTNIISITDGQIYLSSSLYQKGILPAIDTGRSVSRVGGDAQLPAYKSLIGPLKLFYSQFEELEAFTKFGTQLDKNTLMRLNRGRAIRFVLEQKQYSPLSAAEQIAVFTATNAGLFDGLETEQNKLAQQIVCDVFKTKFAHYISEIEKRQKLSSEQTDEIVAEFKNALNVEGLIAS
ncbi:MAG: F0F1 ATP synthase subunit alpha [Alphaproteobacteria bacterium]|nr:F0F1 ATP synthase subunit alpha [Alphaproteobacteria bacterium]